MDVEPTGAGRSEGFADRGGGEAPGIVGHPRVPSLDLDEPREALERGPAIQNRAEFPPGLFSVGCATDGDEQLGAQREGDFA